MAAVILNQGIVSLFINSLWITLLMYKPDNGQFFAYYFTGILPMRTVNVLIMTAVQLVLTPLILKAVDRIPFLKT